MKKSYSKLALLALGIAAICYLGCYEDNKPQSKDYLGMGISNESESFSGTTAAWPPAGFTEQSADQNTIFPDTVATDVAVSAPLPSTFPAHPSECDCVHFLRIKHVKGPINPSDADRILIAQPGILEGAAAFYNVASNLVTRAYNEKGKYVEFWTVDRRPNCLEDLNGMRLVRETGNLHDWVDYYYRNKPYHGQYFAGFLSPYTDAAWLAEMGMAQTITDWNEIITRGIPDQSVRQTKVYLGGHSLGGFITGAYACADFGNDLTTDKNAGYNQCAGFFALDSIVSNSPMAEIMSGVTTDLSSISADAVDMMRQGTLERYVAVSGIIDAEVMNLLSGMGYAAMVDPMEETDLVSYVPLMPTVSMSYRFYHSQNLSDFLAYTPTILKFRYTNQALLAIFTDSNSMPFAFVQASMGFFTGGPVASKNFPLDSNLANLLAQSASLSIISAMLGGGNLAIATDSGSGSTVGPLYKWLNYNELDGVTIPNNAAGVPYTSPANAVTDINDFARSVGAFPMDFVEKYFPMRLAVDSMFGTDGAVYPNGVSQRPVLDITAGNGAKLGGSSVPAGSPVIPGYHHLDVLTAAPVQNDGQPEKVTTNLLNFIFQ